jgi:hypothetical protein
MAVEWLNEDTLTLAGLVAPPAGAVSAALIRSRRTENLPARLRKIILEAEEVRQKLPPGDLSAEAARALDRAVLVASRRLVKAQNDEAVRAQMGARPIILQVTAFVLLFGQYGAAGLSIVADPAYGQVISRWWSYLVIGAVVFGAVSLNEWARSLGRSARAQLGLPVDRKARAAASRRVAVLSNRRADQREDDASPGAAGAEANPARTVS